MAFKNNCFTLIAPIRLVWMCILNRFFIQTSVMVAILVHWMNSSKLLFFYVLHSWVKDLKSVKALSYLQVVGHCPPCPPLYTPCHPFNQSRINPVQCSYHGLSTFQCLQICMQQVYAISILLDLCFDIVYTYWFYISHQYFLLSDYL